MPPLTLELVKASDKEEIAELSRRIWEGDDYIPWVFDAWVSDGGFYCGKLDEKIVALGKYTRHPSGVLWLEGLRVHPDYQGKKLGREMNDLFLDMVEKIEHRVLRFMTAEVNKPSIHMAEEMGFKRTREYRYFVADKDVLASPPDMPSVLDVENNTEEVLDLVRSGPYLNNDFYLRGWTAYPMSEGLLAEEVKAGNCYSVRGNDGLEAVAFFYHYPPYNSLHIAFFAGAVEHYGLFLVKGMHLCREEKKEWYTIKTSSKEMAGAAISVGMKESHIGAVYIYEREKEARKAEDGKSRGGGKTGGVRHRHEHSGGSSQDNLDPGRVLEVIGLKKGDVFFDGGCGNGYLSLAASDIVGKEGMVYASDIYEPGLDALRKEVEKRVLSNLEVLRADLVLGVPLPRASVDLFFMANVFHGFVWNEEVEPVMDEVRRLLRHEGRLAMVEFALKESPKGPKMAERVGPERMVSMLGGYGFIPEKMEEMVGEYHYAMVFVRRHI
ncbi:MAG: bifunctional GNAT family N-acetyltransferase/class I SAM-dependent methyltransferase [Candidatus Thermoplasmatota archaeon]|nr:bifunctional GNAT family N-acetyltransferase/class I SAM-dependent methyltransferase [Candidatus Thermoplasmatota archaeon]